MPSGGIAPLAEDVSTAQEKTVARLHDVVEKTGWWTSARLASGGFSTDAACRRTGRPFPQTRAGKFPVSGGQDRPPERQSRSGAAGRRRSGEAVTRHGYRQAAGRSPFAFDRTSGSSHAASHKYYYCSAFNLSYVIGQGARYVLHSHSWPFFPGLSSTTSHATKASPRLRRKTGSRAFQSHKSPHWLIIVKGTLSHEIRFPV